MTPWVRWKVAGNRSGSPAFAQQAPAVGRMPSGPDSSKAKVRSGRSVNAYSIRSGLASKSGSLDSFQVLVR